MSKSVNNLVQKQLSLSSPYRSFTILDIKKLDKLNEKLSNCGKNFVEFVNKYTSEIFEFPSYCDNRVCSNPDCKKHRGYKFKKAHIEQIKEIEKNIIKPKGWIFTDKKIKLEDINRHYLQKRMSFLYKLLKKFSISAFDIHLEIKLYPVRYYDYTCSKCINFTPKCYEFCRSSGFGYIHFHIVSGGIANLKLVRKIWNYQVKYECAIKHENLTSYICKYSSKTPHFAYQTDMELYHLLVHKLQMNKFSIGKKSIELCQRNSEYIPLSLLEYEIYKIYKRDFEKNNIHHPFLDSYINRGKPPPVNLENFDFEFINDNRFIPDKSPKKKYRLKHSIMELSFKQKNKDIVDLNFFYEGL